MDYLAWVWLNLWYTGFWLEKHLNYLTGLGLILLYTGFGLIKRIIQAEIPLEKYKDFLELSAKQLVILSSLIFLGHIMCDA